MQSHLLAAVVLTNLIVSATSAFDFYKLSLVWPPSACNVGKTCRRGTPHKFTIHGLWPQFANDTSVPKYDKIKNKCTNITPTPPSDIVVPLQPIEAKLRANWPNLWSTDNLVFWKHEWENHGMCSDYPNQPFRYFNAALNLANNYNPVQLMEIQPANKSLHEVRTILENVKRNVGFYPQIACNVLPRTEVKTLQLWEVRFCFKRAAPPSALRDCPNKVAGDCKAIGDEVRFPPAPPIYASNINEQIASS